MDDRDIISKIEDQKLAEYTAGEHDPEQKDVTINLWEFIDIDQLNDLLEELVWENNSLFPVDISYKCQSVNVSGEIVIRATYYLHSGGD